MRFLAESLADMVEAVEAYPIPSRDVPELARLAASAKWTLGPAGYQWNMHERKFTRPG